MNRTEVTMGTVLTVALVWTLLALLFLWWWSRLHRGDR